MVQKFLDGVLSVLPDDGDVAEVSEPILGLQLGLLQDGDFVDFNVDIGYE